MDRFDIPQTIKNIFDKAIEIHMLDASDIFAMGAKHGNNWDALIEDIQLIAFSNIHSHHKIHREMCKVCDAHSRWKMEVKNNY